MIKNKTSKGTQKLGAENSADYKEMPQKDKPGCDKSLLNGGTNLYFTTGKDKNQPGVDKSVFNSINKNLYF